ncbi:MAG: enoyl-CoA hydratase/isomerase family protein [Hasllibacter sp.]
MSGVHVRRDGRAGRITLDRPDALNALTWDMCRAIEAALDEWRDDPAVALLLIEGQGRSFCAGGDIREMWERGRAGDFAYGRRFWSEEYRMNAKLFRFPKPVVSFLQGYTMGGGVGVGCHASHRVVDGTSKVAMPECGIGLVPDVGGSLILARAPGRLGEYLGTTGARMGPGDAIHAGFADYFVPEGWDALKAELTEAGDPTAVDRAAADPPDAPLAALRPFADAHFAGETLRDVLAALDRSEAPEAPAARAALGRVSPLSAACTVELIHRVRGPDDIARALEQEARFTFRAAEHGDFLEGIRAAIIDKDGAPRWRHDGPGAVPPHEVAAMLRPLPKDERLEIAA